MIATAIAPAYVDTGMSAWMREPIPPHRMIPVSDIVRVVDCFGRDDCAVGGALPDVSRAGTSGHVA